MSDLVTVFELPGVIVERVRALAEGRGVVGPDERKLARQRLEGIRRPDPEPTVVPMLLVPPTVDREVQQRPGHYGATDQIRAALARAERPLTVAELCNRTTVCIPLQGARNVLTALHRGGHVEREGDGGRADPYRYRLA